MSSGFHGSIFAGAFVSSARRESKEEHTSALQNVTIAKAKIVKIEVRIRLSFVKNE